MSSLKDKYAEWEVAVPIVEEWKAQNKKIVFTNGCFDLLHPGHVEYLEMAAGLGDKLVVGVNDDESVARLKGEGRPVNDLDFRSRMLAAFACTDLIVPFIEDTPENIIRKLNPDLLVKGGDYSREDIVGADYVESRGGKVKILPFLEGYSTTSLIQRIKKSPS